MQSIDPTALSFDELVSREWLITNSAGGYSSSTLIGLNTRKYHGLLVAAMAPPVRRMVILSRVEETVTVGGRSWALATVEYPGVIHPAGHSLIKAFAGDPFPRWAIQGEGWTIEKSVRFSPTAANDLLISYTLLAGDRPVQFQVKPLFALRAIHDLMYQWSGRLEAEVSTELPGRVRIPATPRTPQVHLAHDGEFVSKPFWYLSTLYRRERERGYSALEDLWMPGEINYSLEPGKAVHLAVSTEAVGLESVLNACEKADAKRPRAIANSTTAANDQAIAQRLAQAAERFAVWAAPAEQKAWTCIVPQYPWTPWAVRDMLIALPGVLLVQGKHAAARTLLSRLADQLRDGLIPSELDELGGEPAYNACDTSLWFINALWQYFGATHDEETAQRLLPVVTHIIEKYKSGTGLGVGVNGDGLLRVRAAGIGSTWMNAKVSEWVITPRNGRPVEVNALWYNALCIGRELSTRFDDPQNAAQCAMLAERHRADFNQRFWNAVANCCFDVVYDSGEDASIRPNQLLAASLPFPVLAEVRVPEMLETVRSKLLTPVGLRTLAPGDPNYQGKYGGDIISRDRAYHQGSIFPWLLGPYAGALAKTLGPWPAAAGAVRRLFAGAIEQLQAGDLAVMPELFDGDTPHKPGGAISDARAVGELARLWHEVVLGKVVGNGGSQLPNAPRTPQLSK